jgi:hypothetical protein
MMMPADRYVPDSYDPPEFNHALDTVRHRSKALFGNADRLQVALYVGSTDGIVSATEIAGDLRMAQNRVRAQLLALTEAGLLMEMPRTSGDRRAFFSRRDSDFWEGLGSLTDDLSIDDHRLPN